HPHPRAPVGGICCGDQAERRTGQAIVWRRVAGNIESIEGFSSQLEGLPFGDFECLECRKINRANSWCTLRTVARVSEGINRFSTVSAATVVDRVAAGVVRRAGCRRGIGAAQIFYRPVSDDQR